MDILNFITMLISGGLSFGEWAGPIALFIVLAERVAHLTPNQTDNKFVAAMRKLGRVIGLDFPDLDTWSTKTSYPKNLDRE